MSFPIDSNLKVSSCLTISIWNFQCIKIILFVKTKKKLIKERVVLSGCNLVAKATELSG